MTKAICWINGSLLSAGEARLPVLDHGLLYGDGVFEGIRFYHGQPFRLSRHLDRLHRSAAAIRLTLPYNIGALDRAVRDTTEAFEKPDGYLRLVVTRGEGELGLDPTGCRRPNLFIIADELAMVSDTARMNGARVIIAATRRLGADGLDPRIKSLNYLNHILARMEASHAGADEAILLNAAGHVTEGTADNVFVVRHGRLFTPPPSDGALEGITRETIMELACELGISVAEKTLGPYDLYTADECFLTGTGAELVPVREVDERPLGACPGPIYFRLHTAFRGLIEHETRRRQPGTHVSGLTALRSPARGSDTAGV